MPQENTSDYKHVCVRRILNNVDGYLKMIVNFNNIKLTSFCIRWVLTVNMRRCGAGLIMILTSDKMMMI